MISLWILHYTLLLNTKNMHNNRASKYCINKNSQDIVKKSPEKKIPIPLQIPNIHGAIIFYGIGGPWKSWGVIEFFHEK